MYATDDQVKINEMLGLRSINIAEIQRLATSLEYEAQVYPQGEFEFWRRQADICQFLAGYFAGAAMRSSSEERYEPNRELLLTVIAEEGGKITARHLHRRKTRLYPTTAAAEAALELLVREGLGKWQVVSTATNQRTEFVLAASQQPSSPSPDAPPSSCTEPE